MIDGAPEVVPLTVDLHQNLAEMPLPTARPHTFDPSFPDLVGDHRAEPMPPETNSFVANIYAALVQQIFDVSQRKWEPDIEHHHQADDFGDGLELLEREAFGHPMTLPSAMPRLKRSSSDKTETGVGGGGVRPIQHALAKPWSNLELVA